MLAEVDPLFIAWRLIIAASRTSAWRLARPAGCCGAQQAVHVIGLPGLVP
jgi:hypothetical protein